MVKLAVESGCRNRETFSGTFHRRCADAALRLHDGVETKGVTSYRVRDRMELKIQGKFEGRSHSIDLVPLGGYAKGGDTENIEFVGIAA